MMLRIALAGACAGLVANVTGYVITGRVFHAFQAKTPGTWRAVESWSHYMAATALRIAACIGIALVYNAFRSAWPTFDGHPILSGVEFGLILWSVSILPVVLEAALFVNWHRGFVLGLLLDWMVVCMLASSAAALAVRIA